MRILIVGATAKRWRTEHYIRRGFEANGHRVFGFDSARYSQLPGNSVNRLLEWYVRRIKPDYVLATRARGVSPDTLARICHGRSAAMWYFDAPPQIPEDVTAKAVAVGTLFITNRGQVDHYRHQGVRRVLFLPQACDSTYHRRLPSPNPFRYQASFVGTVGSEESRSAFIQSVAGRVDLHVWGKSNPREASGYTVHRRAAHNRDLCRVVADSMATIGVNSFAGMDTIHCYASNRVWLTLGCGGLFLGYRAPGIDSVVPGGLYCDYYTDARELADKIAFYGRKNDTREEVVERGHRWAHAHHTYTHRAKNLVAFEEYSLLDGGVGEVRQ